jgi:hypothetical protein
MGATHEGPLASEPVAAVHRDRLPTRGRERGAKDDLRMPLQDLRRACIRQPGQARLHRERELQRPASGAIVARHLFHHAEQTDRVELQPAERRGARHAIEPGLPHRVHDGP